MCEQFFAGFGTSMGFYPPGQPSRRDECNPRGRFLNFALWVLLCNLEYMHRTDMDLCMCESIDRITCNSMQHVCTKTRSHASCRVVSMHPCLNGRLQARAHIHTNGSNIAHLHLCTHVCGVLPWMHTWTKGYDIHMLACIIL